MVRELESVVAQYRRENARARGLAPEDIVVFRGPVDLGISSDGHALDLSSFRGPAEEAEEQLRELARRFRDARDRFNRDLTTWQANDERA